jgi:type VI secretion system protein ImpF
MVRGQGDVTVTLSILDRLIDWEPKNQVEAPLSRAQSVRVMKNSVRRDLEWLLNSRSVAFDPDEALREVNRSLYVYGLPDFSSYAAASAADQAKLLREIQGAIKLFEPRLADLRIIPVEVPGSGLKEFKLRIEALLRMDPSPEPVSFDTVIELKSGVCRISGGANAG